MSVPALTFFGHAFGQTYTLPVPLWLFLFGAGAAVILSFVVLGLFFDKPTIRQKQQRSSPRPLGGPAAAGRFIGVLLLAVTVISGLLGTQESFYNFSVPFFWIVFLLGFTYAVALFGNLWDFMNPFKTLFEGLEGLLGRTLEPRIAYPAQLSYYPALVIYFGLIWLELLAKDIGTVPQNLAWLLIGYTALTLTAAYLFGKDAWFKYGELFSVFFGLVSRVSPINVREAHLSFRKPFIGLTESPGVSFSLLIFVLFMLSSTGFDGLKETVFFTKATELLPGFLTSNYLLFETLVLALSPFFLLGIYGFFIVLMKRLIHTKLSIRQLAYSFALSLIPIAIAYNIAHYFTLLLIPGQAIIPAISDPLGSGLNLFGTAGYEVNETFLTAFAVWYSQIALIVIGHIAAVFVAHVEALKIFSTRKQALLSQIPMLILMVLYTAGSLWIISQPIAV